MAGNSLALVWDLIARDQASPAFARVGAAAEEAGAKTEAASTKIGGGIATAAKVATGAGLAFAAISVKMAADFETSTTRLVTSANESAKNLKMVQQGILDLAGQVGYSTDDLTAAMYKVESGGQHGAAGLATLKAAAQGAKTENADLTVVADAVTSAMTDYHLKASQAADVTSKLVAATASGKMTFEELSGSLAAILPVASANHVALNDILGDLASMTMHGMSAEQASQNLADAIRHLAAPTQQQQKEFAALGLTAQQITADLGTKGLSGTINVIGDAIRAQMGGSTSQVVLDLNTALSRLPAPVKELGKSILDGTISLGDYRKAMKELPAEQAIAAQSFMGLVSSTHQIGNETKSGAQIYQSYSGALRQALGDATGMNVALMIGGENAGNTAAAIKNVTAATADAKGNVKGWTEIQSTFNQQASETVHSLEAMTIEAGMHLLPALTSAMGYINRDGLPALKGLASAVGDAAHWWSELPTPIRDVGYALAGIKIAEMLGLWSRLTAVPGALAGGFRTAAASMGGFSAEMTVQQRLAQMDAAALTEVDRALGGLSVGANAAAGSMTRVQMMMAGWDAELAAMVVEEDAATASTGRLSAAMSTAAIRGFGAAQSAGRGVMNMLGGPWGAALLGATAVVGVLVAGIQAAKDKQNQWTEAIKQGGQAMEQAQADMAKTAASERELNSGFTGFMATLTGQKGVINAMSPDVQKATQSYKDWYNSLGLVDQKSQDVTQATAHLSEILKTHAADSLAVREAEDGVRRAQQDLKVATDELNQSTKTSAQLSREQADNLLALSGSSLAVKQSYDEFRSSLDQYRKDAVDPAIAGTARLTTEQDALNSSALSVAQAAGIAGQAWAKSNGITDTATAGQYAQLLALQKVANAMGTDTPAAISSLIGSLQASVSQGHLTAKQMDAITAAVDGIPGQKKVDVTADTDQAQSAINGLLGMYQHVQYTGSAIMVNGRVVANADGNLLKAFASGGMSPMSSSVAQVVKPGTLRVIGDNPVADEAFIPINNSARSLSILGETASRMGLGLHAMADGGITDRFWAQPSQAMLATVRAVASAAASTAPGAPGNVSANAALGQMMAARYGWGSGSEWNSLYALWKRESGWNNNAQNPTSTAYGIPQFLNSTWASMGFGKTSDAATQIAAGLKYISQRYGDPNRAWGHETSAGWYDRGGWLMPGATLAMNGTGKPERIRTAEQEAALQRELSGGQSVVGIVVNGDVHADPDQLANRARIGTQRALATYGVRT